ncbi:MAG: tail fiber protein, partial [Bacteroidia bacterium]
LHNTTGFGLVAEPAEVQPTQEGNTGTEYQVEILSNIITPRIPLSGGVSAGRGGFIRHANTTPLSDSAILVPIKKNTQLKSSLMVTERNSRLTTLSSLTLYMVQKSKLKRTASILLVLLSIWSLSGAEAQAQGNVGIGTTTPNPKAILELNANDKGFLAPRMNTLFMNALAPTATESALLIYNTDSACYHFYNGTVWKNLCQKGLDTAVINKAIKNYLSNITFTTVINNMLVDSSVTNYTTINTAIVNNITIDSSIVNYTTINNAVVNNLTVDSSITNFTTINTAIVNNITIDSSIVNYTTINNALVNNLTVDSSITNFTAINTAIVNNITIDSSIVNYTTINNALVNNLTVDSSITNFANINILQGDTATFNTLTVGGQNIMTTMSDSIKAQAWLLKGNASTNPNTNFIGTSDNKSLRFRTNNIEKMIVDSIGNVGIGTNKPVILINHGLPTLLDVRGSAILQGRLTLTKYGETPLDLKPTWHIDQDSLYRAFRIFRQPNVFTPGAVAVWIDSTLNVGIGTSTPASPLTVATGSGQFTNSIQVLASTHSTSRRASILLDDWLFDQDMLGTGVKDFSLYQISTSTHRMVVLPNGNVGIGNSAPSQTLNVVGTTLLSRDNTAACCGARTLEIAEQSSSTGHYPSIGFHNSGEAEAKIELRQLSPTGLGTTARRLVIADDQAVGTGLQLTGNLYYGNSDSRTQTRLDAGLQGNAGAQSGFYENDGATVTNYPAGAAGWWHLIEDRHSNPTNNYALQIAGSFFDQNLYYRKTNNNATTPWTKIGGSTPAGMISYFANVTVPAGYLECNGQAVSRTTYADLFAAISTLYGVGDGTTTFNLPDLRGEFIRGADHARGVDPGRVLGTAQAATGIDDQVYQTVDLFYDNADATAPSGSYNSSGGYAGTTRNHTRLKVRPRNVAMMPCIKF